MYEPPKRRKLTKAERQTVYDKCGGHCAYCGTEITIRQMQVDHVEAMAGSAGPGQRYIPQCRKVWDGDTESQGS